jgi:hypothetical protein
MTDHGPKNGANRRADRYAAIVIVRCRRATGAANHGSGEYAERHIHIRCRRTAGQQRQHAD